MCYIPNFAKAFVSLNLMYAPKSIRNALGKGRNPKNRLYDAIFCDTFQWDTSDILIGAAEQDQDIPLLLPWYSYLSKKHQLQMFRLLP